MRSKPILLNNLTATLQSLCSISIHFDSIDVDLSYGAKQLKIFVEIRQSTGFWPIDFESKGADFAAVTGQGRNDF